MGKCLSVEKQEEFNTVLRAFDLILTVADNNNLSTCDIIEELIEQCRMIANTNEIEFFYSKTIANKLDTINIDSSYENDGITEAQYIGIPSNFTHFLSIKIQGMEFGKLAFEQDEMDDIDEKKLQSLVAYTTQLIERNHLQQQAASIISIVEVQREYKKIPNIIESICTIISNTIRCEYVTIFKTDTSGTEKLRQLYPQRSEIHGFNHGIVGYVAQNKHFIVYNNKHEKVSQGIGRLDVEKIFLAAINEDANEIHSVLCVPMLDDDLNEVIGIALCMNKLDDEPFTYLEVDMLQTLNIEIGHILEKYSTKLFINDIIQHEDDSVKSLLKAYRSSHVQGAPKISQIMTPVNNRLADQGNKNRRPSLSISSINEERTLPLTNANNTIQHVNKHRSPSVSRSKSPHASFYGPAQQIPELKTRHSLSEKIQRRESISIQNSRRSSGKSIRRDSSSISVSLNQNILMPALSISPTNSLLQIKRDSDNNDRYSENRQVQRQSVDDTNGILSSQGSVTPSLSRRGSGSEQKKKRSRRNSVAVTMGAQVNLTNLVSNKSSKFLKDIVDFKFDPFEHDIKDLRELAIKIFDDFDLITSLKIPMIPFTTFIKQICDQYKDNPYHNVYHGFSVLGFSYAYIKRTSVQQNFSKLDILSLLVAALCHDVSHPGNTNNFEVDTLSKLAIKHNDVSVLENHHCQVTFMTLFRSECNFIAGFKAEDRKLFRKRVIRSILDTDMSHHFELCSTLDQIDKLQFDQNMLNPDKNDKFIQMICGVFVHSADLSAPLQPLLLAIKWAKMICQEFTNQVEKEKELGLESLAMMKGLEQNENFLKSQSGFFKFVLRPLFKSVIRLWPELKHLYLQLLSNEQYFESELERIQIEKKREAKLRLSGNLGRSLSICPRIGIPITPPNENDAKSEDTEHQKSADYTIKILNLQHSIDVNDVVVKKV